MSRYNHVHNPFDRLDRFLDCFSSIKPLQVEISGIAGPIVNLKIDARVVYNRDRTIRFWRATILPTKIDQNSPEIVLLSNKQPLSKPEPDELEVKMISEKTLKAFIAKNPEKYIEYKLLYVLHGVKLPLPTEFPEGVLRLDLIKQECERPSTKNRDLVDYLIETNGPRDVNQNRFDFITISPRP